MEFVIRNSTSERYFIDLKTLSLEFQHVVIEIPIMFSTETVVEFRKYGNPVADISYDRFRNLRFRIFFRFGRNFGSDRLEHVLLPNVI